LYSRQVLSFDCINRDGKWKVGNLKWEKTKEESDPGIERLGESVALLPPALIWFSSPLQKQWYLRDYGNADGSIPGEFDDVSFEYGVRGKPQDAANKYMEFLFGSRTHADPWVGNEEHPVLEEYSYIAHSIALKASCPSGKGSLTAAITGTFFPTHHLFVNGKHIQTVPQDKFDKLWVPEYRQNFRNLWLTEFRNTILAPQ
jgi:hypothetical protein